MYGLIQSVAIHAQEEKEPTKMAKQQGDTNQTSGQMGGTTSHEKGPENVPPGSKDGQQPAGESPKMPETRFSDWAAI